MKKFFLFSIAVLLAGSSVAQTLGRQNMPAKSKTQVVNKGTMKTYVNKPVAAGISQYVKKVAPATNFVKLAATNNISSLTPRKAAALQGVYNGTGRNYQTQEPAKWVMQTAVEKGTTYLIDMIPLPSEWSSLEAIAVKCEVSGNTLTVAPQCVVSGETQTGEKIYYFIHSWTSEDGSIVLTLGEDGSLNTIEGEDIAYSAFSANEFSLLKDGPYLGLVLDIEKVKYFMEGQVVTPVAGYEPESFFLHPGCNVNGNYYDNVLMPAFTNITLTNRTDIDCDSYAWSVQAVEYDAAAKQFVPTADAITGSTKDFTFPVTTGYYSPATLVSTYQGASSTPFAWNEGVWMAGGDADSWDDGSSPTCTFTKANSANELSLLNPAGCSAMIYYQGKPSAPLYFTGVNIAIYQFAVASGKELNMTAKICKAHRDVNGVFSLGEVIAQSDCDKEVETGSLFTRVNFNSFYVEDEFGMTSDLDYLLLDEEFAIVIDGWDNETFSGRPIIVSSSLTTGYSSTYAIVSGETEYRGAGWSNTGVCLVGFNNATYGYLHTENPTDLVIPAEGGTARVDGIYPMFCTFDDNDNKTTMLWLENEDYPDWVEVNIANESYTDEAWGFDLTFTAEALPEGVSGRTGKFVFAQRGARLTVTVSQGATEGVQTVVTSKVANGKTYDLSGRQVNGKKGLVVRDGKKFIVK